MMRVERPKEVELFSLVLLGLAQLIIRRLVHGIGAMIRAKP